ncbi:uncharacterized protein LOC135369437 [Ornithodoros turicata]|uniref:uncharacterized protein LOC135369437 n=1 Tax=Ornithodoros turicata TaxID=34597 RepID=UPI0031396738
MTPALLPLVCGTIILALVLAPTVRWLRVWIAMRHLPGPSRVVPFWYLLRVTWSKRHTSWSDVTTEFFSALRELSSRYTSQNYMVYMGLAPVVILQTPEAAEALLANKTNNRKPFLYKFLEVALGPRNMLTSCGDIWQRKRRLMAPSFHAKCAEQFLVPFNEEADCLLERITKEVTGDKCLLPMTRHIRHSSIQSIFAAGMGTRIKSSKVRVVSSSAHLIELSLVGRAFRPWTWYQSIYDLTAEGKWFRERARELHEIVAEVVDERRALDVEESPPDILTAGREGIRSEHGYRTCLDVILEKTRNDDCSSEEILHDMNLMIGAAYETTTTAAVLCLYLVSLDPEVQRKIQDEQDAIFAGDIDRDVTMADIEEMTYLSCCLKETLRLFPSLPFIARVLDHDLTIEGHVIPKGVICAVNIFQLHRDSTTFHDPEEFIPDRFMNCNEKQWHPYAYIPFSSGPRKCIGQSFSYVEIKVFLSKLFRRFTFVAQKPLEEIKFKFEVVLKVKDGIHVWASRRNRRSQCVTSPPLWVDDLEKVQKSSLDELPTMEVATGIHNLLEFRRAVWASRARGTAELEDVGACVGTFENRCGGKEGSLGPGEATRVAQSGGADPSLVRLNGEKYLSFCITAMAMLETVAARIGSGLRGAELQPLSHFTWVLVFLLLLYPVSQWLRVLICLRHFPGPSRIVPFWYTLSAYWSKRKTEVRGMTTALFDVVRDLSSRYKDRNYCGYLGFVPIVVLQTPEAAESLLGNKTNNRKPFPYNFLKPWMGSRNTLTSSGEVWQKKRKLIATSFNAQHSQPFLAAFNREANSLLEKVVTEVSANSLISINKCIKFSPLKCTLSAGMGVTLEEDKVHLLSACMHLMEFSLMVRFFRPWTWYQSIYDVTREGKWFGEMARTAQGICNEVQEERKKIQSESEKFQGDSPKYIHRTYLDVLLEKHNADASYSTNEITGDMIFMFTAGNETTVASLMVCLYLVSLHPDVQRKIQEEQDAIFATDVDRDVTIEDIQKMTYLTCALKESMRLLPPVPCIARTLDQDLTIDGHVVPKGVTCVVDIFGLHHNATSFHDPEKFIPERFMDENDKRWHPFSYIPFSGGPRKCLGPTFSYMEMKVLLSKLFRHFNFKAEKPLDQIKFALELVIKVKGGIYVWASRRKPVETYCPNPSAAVQKAG